MRPCAIGESSLVHPHGPAHSSAIRAGTSAIVAVFSFVYLVAQGFAQHTVDNLCSSHTVERDVILAPIRLLESETRAAAGVATLSSRQGIECSLAAKVFLAAHGNAVLEGGAPATSDVVALLPKIAGELQLYPAGVLTKAHFRRIVFCDGLAINGAPVAGTVDGGQGMMFLDAKLCQRDLAVAIHHEVFHLIDQGNVACDADGWVSLNPKGFRYSFDLPSEMFLWERDAAKLPTGFVDTYATAAIQEDMAETYALMVTSPDYISARSEKDAIVRGKRVAIEKGLLRFDARFDENFWTTMREYRSQFLDCVLNEAELRVRHGTDGCLAASPTSGHCEDDARRAISAYTRAIDGSPGQSQLYAGRGRALCRLGEWEEALKDFDAAVREAESDAPTYQQRGYALARLGKIKEAIADLTKAIALRRDDPFAYLARGWVRISAGEFASGIEDCSKAIELAPGDADAYLQRAYARNRIGEFERSIADCTHAIELGATNSRVFAQRGFARAAQRDYDGALSDYDRAIMIEPNNADHYDRRSCLHCFLGHRAQAIADLSNAIRIAPGSAELYSRRARLFAEVGDDRGAEDDLRIAKRLGYDPERQTKRAEKKDAGGTKVGGTKVSGRVGDKPEESRE